MTLEMLRVAAYTALAIICFQSAVLTLRRDYETGLAGMIGLAVMSITSGAMLVSSYFSGREYLVTHESCLLVIGIGLFLWQKLFRQLCRGPARDWCLRRDAGTRVSKGR